MANDHEKQLDKMVRDLREAADHLDSAKGKTPEEANQAATDVQSCCGTCTGVSPIPPCSGACIQVSALF